MLIALPATPRGAGEATGKVAWVDLLDPTPDERSMVEIDFGLRLPTRDNLSEVQSSSRMAEENGVLFMSVPAGSDGPAGDGAVSPIGFVLSKEVLITLRYAQSRSFDTAAEKFSRSERRTSTEAFAIVVEELVESTADRLENLATELDQMSRSVFRRAVPFRRRSREALRYKLEVRSNEALRNKLIDVGNVGEQLSRLRGRLVGLQRILPFASGPARHFISGEVRSRLHVAQGDLASLTDYQTHLSEKVQFLLDAVLGFISTKQNDIFTVLTVVSVIGIPPMLVASIYGMNFKNMPELSWVWGYPFALALIVLSTVLPILWFKWRGWL